MFDETLKSVAEKLVANCREERVRAGLDELYAEDAVSVEAAAMEGGETPVANGRKEIHAKHDWWESTMEMHSASTDGPYLHGSDRFAVIFEADTTNRETGERSQMKEVGIYTVSGGKIVREEFYWAL
ncbi:MAG: nuclear transport factor 2 family protein [Pseudomonadota bacterium]